MLSEMLVSALVLYRKWLLLMSRCGMKRVFGGRQGYICPWIYFFCVCLSVKCTDLTPDMFETRTVDLHSVSFRWIVTRQPWISTPQSIGRRFSKSRGKWDQHTTLFFSLKQQKHKPSLDATAMLRCPSSPWTHLLKNLALLSCALRTCCSEET